MGVAQKGQGQDWWGGDPMEMWEPEWGPGIAGGSGRSETLSSYLKIITNIILLKM